MSLVMVVFTLQLEAGTGHTEQMTRKRRYRDISVQRNWKQKELKRGIPNKTLQGIWMLVESKACDTGPAALYKIIDTEDICFTLNNLLLGS